MNTKLYGQKVRKHVPRIFAIFLAFIATLSALGFLEALEHARPPSGGLGIGVDRS